MKKFEIVINEEDQSTGIEKIAFVNCETHHAVPFLSFNKTKTMNLYITFKGTEIYVEFSSYENNPVSLEKLEIGGVDVMELLDEHTQAIEELVLIEFKHRYDD